VATLRTVALDELRPLPPVRPAQILQAGANYRTHVIDLQVAEALRGHARAGRRARKESAKARPARPDRHALPVRRLPSALCGAHDDVVLPTRRHAAGLGAGGGRSYWPARVPDHAGEVDHVIAGYVMVNDLTLRDRVFPRTWGGFGSDWVASKNAPTFLPTGPWLLACTFVEDRASYTSGWR